MLKNPRVEELLRRLNPSETALQEWLQPRIDNAMLRAIANSDSGGSSCEEYFRALKRIQQGKQIPLHLHWIPRYVLEVNRFCEPDTPEWIAYSAEYKGEHGHLIRAFCCAVLFRAADDPEVDGYVLGDNYALIQLLASVLYLGREAMERALRLFCWRILRLPEYHDERPFYSLGLLLLYASLFETTQDGAGLIVLAEWVVEEVDWVISIDMIFGDSEEWLLGLTNYDLRHEVWRRLSQEILLDPSKGYPEPCATVLRDIAHRLVPPERREVAEE